MIKILASIILIQNYLTNSLSGYIRPSYNSTEEFKNIKATLNGHIVSRVDKNGIFQFTNLEKGRYILEVFSIGYKYPTHEIEVSETVTAYYVDRKQGIYSPVPVPLQFGEISNQQYFEIKQPINPANFLKGPYGIIIAITVGLIICMKNMPDMEEMQASAQAVRT